MIVKKYYKSILCICLVMAVLLLQIPVNAQETGTGGGTFSTFEAYKHKSKLLDKPYQNSYSDQLDSVERPIYDTIEKNILVMRNNTAMKIEVPIFTTYHTDNNAEMSAMLRVLFTAVYAFELDHPQLFWYSKYHAYGYDYDKNNKEIKSLYLVAYENSWRSSDFPTKEILSDAEEAFNDAVNAVLSGMDQSGIYSKVKYLHDYVVEESTYNQYIAEGSATPQELGELPWSAYSVLVPQEDQKKQPVCEAYSKAFNVLCNKAGIKCISVAGHGGSSSDPDADVSNHMWNAVKMQNGSWFFVDTTFDDMLSDRIVYNFFLKGTKEMAKTHIPMGQFSASSGCFNYPEFNEYDYPQRVGDSLGDVNCDDVINTADAARLLRYLADLCTLSSSGRSNADFYCDRNINTADAARILRYCAGM